jgi:hypothetical protein
VSTADHSMARDDILICIVLRSMGQMPKSHPLAHVACPLCQPFIPCDRSHSCGLETWTWMREADLLRRSPWVIPPLSNTGGSLTVRRGAVPDMQERIRFEGDEPVDPMREPSPALGRAPLSSTTAASHGITMPRRYWRSVLGTCPSATWREYRHPPGGSPGDVAFSRCGE